MRASVLERQFPSYSQAPTSFSLLPKLKIVAAISEEHCLKLRSNNKQTIIKIYSQTIFHELAQCASKQMQYSCAQASVLEHQFASYSQAQTSFSLLPKPRSNNKQTIGKAYFRPIFHELAQCASKQMQYSCARASVLEHQFASYSQAPTSFSLLPKLQIVAAVSEEHSPELLKNISSNISVIGA